MKQTIQKELKFNVGQDGVNLIAFADPVCFTSTQSDKCPTNNDTMTHCKMRAYLRDSVHVTHSGNLCRVWE